MIRSRAGWILGVLSLLTLWGCAEQPASPAAIKTTRLQDEIRTLTAVRDHLRQDLHVAQEEKNRIQAQLDKITLASCELTKERDDLRQTLSARIAERDHTHAQLEQLRKGVRNLMEQVDAMAPSEAAGSTGAE